MEPAFIMFCLLVLCLPACTTTMRSACESVCSDKFNYHYAILYDDQNRVTMIASSTRFDIKLDNGTMTEFDTSPSAPSGVIRSVWETVSKFIGGIVGGVL